MLATGLSDRLMSRERRRLNIREAGVAAEGEEKWPAAEASPPRGDKAHAAADVRGTTAPIRRFCAADCRGNATDSGF